MTIRPQDPDDRAWRDVIYPPYTLVSQSPLMGENQAPLKCSNFHCNNPEGFLDSPFCDDCIWKLWAHIDGTQPEEKKAFARQGWFDEIHRITAEQEEREAETEERVQRIRRERRTTMPGTIYYLRVGSLVKIGFTVDMERRMRHYPPDSELLASHPGTRETERQMHHKFLHRVAKGREWFTPCDEIDEHIAEVLEQFSAKAA